VYPMLPVSLDCPFLISPSVFSNVYFRCILSIFHAIINMELFWRCGILWFSFYQYNCYLCFYNKKNNTLAQFVIFTFEWWY